MKFAGLLFVLLFFEKNAVAVVQSKVINSVQLIENQSVSHPSWISKKYPSRFFLKQKRTPNRSQPDVKRANRKARAALIFGLLGCAMFVPAVLAASSIALVLMIVYPILAIFLGLIAFREKTSKGMAAAWGICLGLLTLFLIKLASLVGGEK